MFKINDIKYNIRNYTESQYLSMLMKNKDREDVHVEKDDEYIILNIDFDRDIVRDFVQCMNSDVSDISISDRLYDIFSYMMIDKILNAYNFDSEDYRKLYISNTWNVHHIVHNMIPENHKYYIMGTKAYNKCFSSYSLGYRTYYFFISDSELSKFKDEMINMKFNYIYIENVYKVKDDDEYTLFFRECSNEHHYVYNTVFNTIEDIFNHIELNFSENLELLLDTDNKTLYTSSKFNNVFSTSVITLDISKIHTETYIRELFNMHVITHDKKYKLHIPYLYSDYDVSSISSDMNIENCKYRVNINNVFEYLSTLNIPIPDDELYPTYSLYDECYYVISIRNEDKRYQCEMKIRELCDELHIEYDNDEAFYNIDMLDMIDNDCIIQSMRFYHSNIKKITFDILINYMNSGDVNNIYDYLYRCSEKKIEYLSLALILYSFFDIHPINITDDIDLTFIDDKYILKI